MCADVADDVMEWIAGVDAMRDSLAATQADVLAMRGELDVFRQTMRADFAEFEHRVDRRLDSMSEGMEKLRSEIAKSRADLILWSFVFWVSSVGAIAALAGVLRR